MAYNTLQKNEKQEGTIGPFWEWMGRGRGHKEKVKNKYGGCVLYSYMKIED
jgi:hypothetical protein